MFAKYSVLAGSRLSISAMHSASAESEIMDSVDLWYTSADAADYA